MIPTFNRTITCIWPTQATPTDPEVWQSATVRGCFFGDDTNVTPTDTGVSSRVVTLFCRIPKAAAAKAALPMASPARERMIIVKGETDMLPGVDGATASSLLNAFYPDIFIAKAFKDNTNGPLPHWWVSSG